MMKKTSGGKRQSSKREKLSQEMRPVTIVLDLQLELLNETQTGQTCTYTKMTQLFVHSPFSGPKFKLYVLLLTILTAQNT